MWYQKSDENLTYVASRSISLECLSNHDPWWYGSTWLSESFNPWPMVPDDLSGHQSFRVWKTKIDSIVNSVLHDNHTKPKFWESAFRFSTLNRLLKVTAHIRLIFRLTEKIKLKSSVNRKFKFFEFPDLSAISWDHLRPSELLNSRLLWAYHCQQTFFLEKI